MKQTSMTRTSMERTSMERTGMKRTSMGTRRALGGAGGLVLALMVFSGPGSPVLAGEMEASRPTVETVLAKVREALGGEHLEGLRSFRKRGIYVLNGLEHPLSIHQLRPGKIRWEVEGLHRYGAEILPGKRVIRAVDGERAWTVIEERSPVVQELDGEEASALMAAADPWPPLVDLERRGYRVELVGREQGEGGDLYHLRVTFPGASGAGGRVEHWYVDAETHLPRRRATEAGEDGEGRSWLYDDYREVGGIRVPFHTILEGGIFAPEEILETVEVNVDMSEAIFRAP